MPNLPLDDLFQQADPAPPQESLPPPQPSPVDYLGARVDGLANAVSTLIQQQRDANAYQQGQRSMQQQQEAQEAGQPGWQPRTYFNKADSLALLASQAPEETLNQVFNQVGQSVYEPLRQEIEAVRYSNEQLRSDLVAARALEEKARQAQENEQHFYGAYEDLRPYAFLVPLEAQAIAQESQRNPAAFAGRSEADIYALLAQRVRSRVWYIRGDQDGSQPDASPPEQTTGRGLAQRTYMERGSGTRAQAPMQSNDPNVANLSAMHQFLRNAKR